MRKFNTAEIVSGIVADAAKQSEQVLAYVKMVEALEDAGVDVSSVNQWSVKACSAIAINRADLTKVRRVVGRLKTEYKTAAYDFAETNELIVSIKPTDKSCEFGFTYRTKFRKGGKCNVVEAVEPAYVSHSLVCKA